MRYVQLESLVVFIIAAVLVVGPWLRRSSRADALSAMLWIHAFRYVAVLVSSTQREGYPISDTAVREIVAGDVLGSAIAVVAIVLLARRSAAGVAVTWLVVAETLADAAFAVHRRLVEPLRVEPTGIWQLVLGFFVPMVVVSVPVLIWQLVARRDEPLGARRRGYTAS